MTSIPRWVVLMAALLLLPTCTGSKRAPLGTRAECQETGGVWLSDGTCFYSTK
jgi:hypothetical protein